MSRWNVMLANKAHRLGGVCKMYRTTHLKGVGQKTIAESLGCSREAVSQFERGTNPNAVIFLWYIQHGLLDTYSSLIDSPSSILGDSYEDS